MTSSSVEVKKYYDKKASSYDDYSKQLWSRLYDEVTWNLIKPYVPTDSKALVFDAAGGTGKWSLPIAKRGPRVILGDFSIGMLSRAREKIAREGLQWRVETRECDLRKLDFPDCTFDLVFCEHALCFVKEQEVVIRELARVLKKGCPLIVSGQNRYVLALLTLQQDPRYALSMLSSRAQPVMRESLNVYALSLDEFRRLLETNGLKVEKLFGKLFTTPLALPEKQMVSEKFSNELFKQLLSAELEMSKRSDAAALAGHFQAIGYKQYAVSTFKVN